jgi:hypothetical protein
MVTLMVGTLMVILMAIMWVGRLTAKPMVIPLVQQ